MALLLTLSTALGHGKKPQHFSMSSCHVLLEHGYHICANCRNGCCQSGRLKTNFCSVIGENETLEIRNNVEGRKLQSRKCMCGYFFAKLGMGWEKYRVAHMLCFSVYLSDCEDKS